MTAAIAPLESYCRDCGATLSSRAEICPKCGIRQTMPATAGRNRTTAAIFAIFLGGLGVHKFYLGQPGQGIVYLLFCWTFIPAIVGFIEGIVYASMSEQAFSAKYNTV